MGMVRQGLAVLGNYALGAFVVLFTFEMFTGILTGILSRYLFRKYPDTFPLYKPLLRWIRRRRRPMRFSVRMMRAEDAPAFLRVHHAAVRGIAAADYPAEVIKAWAPLPISIPDVERFLANPNDEIRLVAETKLGIMGVGGIILKNSELSACYAAPQVARTGIGTAIVREIEQIARAHRLRFLELKSSLTAEPFYQSLGYISQGRIMHRMGSGQEMAGIKMRKDFLIETQR